MVYGNLVVSEYIYNTTIINLDSESRFNNLTLNQKQYYTINANYNYEYTFHIKGKISYIPKTSSLSISFIGHTGKYPNTNSNYNEDQGSLNFSSSLAYSGYITLFFEELSLFRQSPKFF